MGDTRERRAGIAGLLLMTGARNKHAYMMREKEINAAIAEKRVRDFRWSYAM